QIGDETAGLAVRQTVVEQHQVGLLVGDGDARFAEVARLDHRVAAGLEEVANGEAKGALVIDDEDPVRGHWLSCMRGISMVMRAPPSSPLAATLRPPCIPMAR